MKGLEEPPDKARKVSIIIIIWIHAYTLCIQLHDGTDSSEERVRIYHSLGYGTTDVLTYSCLDFSLSVSTVGPTFTIIIMIQTSLAGQTLMGEEGNRDVRV